MTKEQYAGSANELSNRILKLIPDNPQILTMVSARDLFDVPGFNSKDLDPTLFQAMWALGKAKHDYETTAKSSTPSPQR